MAGRTPAMVVPTTTNAKYLRDPFQVSPMLRSRTLGSSPPPTPCTSLSVMLLSARRPAQITLNKWRDVPFQDSLGISHFNAGAVILDQGVGMDHIGTDLAPPLRRQRFTF